jgi:NADH-quinone oxidoreductase subunit L
LDNAATFGLLTGIVLIAPLLSFLLCLLVPNRYSWAAAILASMLLFVSASFSIYLFTIVPAGTSTLIHVEWFHVGQFSFNGNIELNRLSILMMPLVAVISFAVHLYSIGYMAGDSGTNRYFAMLGFFTFSMLGIVLADNLLMIFIFWELVGFSSYLLIGHWFEKPVAAKAAQKAFIFNRIGDAGFLIGIMIVWANTQTLNLQEVLQLTEIYSWQTAASLFIFCGVIGKSAQFPLFTWLPDAMEGPTPVSALIHAATMVAAGVFLLARVFPLFTIESLNIVAIVGSATALLAALCALNQFDIKKILAYSTVSQLGLMITAIGVGSENAAMLHLTTHAFFKACLFLGAGSIIYSLQIATRQTENIDVQDIRNMGGLKKKLPFTFLLFALSSASLAGVPFFSGFLSKDSVIASIWSWADTDFSWRWLILFSILITSFITVLYTFRMVWYIFFGKENQSLSGASESPWIMRLPIIILAFGSAWFFISLNPFNPLGWFTELIGGVSHSIIVTGFSAGLVLVAFICAWFVYAKASAVKSLTIFQNGLNIDLLYQKLVTPAIIQLGNTAEATDRKWIDGLLHFVAYAHVAIAHAVVWFDKYIIDGSVNTTAWVAGKTGSITRSFQAGKIQFYIFWAVMGLIIFLFFILI